VSLAVAFTKRTRSDDLVRHSFIAASRRVLVVLPTVEEIL
jgi:hypothetical protein